MKWERLPNGDYQAQGENGDFLIWKSSQLWKCRYRSKDQKTLHQLRPRYSLKEAKKQAEENYYWEDKK